MRAAEDATSGRPTGSHLVTGLAGRGLFRPEALRGLLDSHVAVRADHGHKLWNLMVLELWMRQFLDRRR